MSHVDSSNEVSPERGTTQEGAYSERIYLKQDHTGKVLEKEIQDDDTSTEKRH